MEYIDPKARRLVSAINESRFEVQTVGCCSGHYHKPSTPYVGLRSEGWDFLSYLLTVTTALNEITGGQTSLVLRSQHGSKVAAIIRFKIYPWLWTGVDLYPILAERVTPPRRLVRLWWRELDELAATIEENRIAPSDEFGRLFQAERSSSGYGRRRYPSWAKPFV